MEEQTAQPEEIKEEKKEEPDELSKCQREREEYLDGWKRAKAELLNYKKDEAKRLEIVVKLANEGLVNDLLGVLDSFDLGLAALEKEGLAQKGMYLIRSQLEDILKSYGLERIVISRDQAFDPARQEAIVEVESDKPTGTVIEEVGKGYLLNGRVIRPARVKISK